MYVWYDARGDQKAANKLEAGSGCATLSLFDRVYVTCMCDVRFCNVHVTCVFCTICRCAC